MREYTVDLKPVPLSVRDHPGEDPPVVALHGLASNARWWDLVAADLDQRVIAVDQRGHGLSAKPDSGYDIAAAASDMAALSSALELGPHVVVGHSWGASVAVEYAALASAKVSGVVLVDGGTVSLSSVFGGDWKVAKAALTPPTLQGVTAERLRGYVSGGGLVRGSDLDTATEILLGNFEEGDVGLRPRLRLDRHMQIAHDLFDWDPLPAIANLACPVLIIAAKDGSAPRERIAIKQASVDAAVAAAHAGAEVAWIDGGHDLPVETPAEVAAAIKDFIQHLE